MPCFPCLLLAGLPGLGELTQQQKFDASRYQEMVGLHSKLAARAGALPISPERTSVIAALSAVRANLNQISGVSPKVAGAATWFDKIFGYTPQSGSTANDYLTNPALFDREYNENMAELNRIDQYLARLTAAPVVGRPQVDQPAVTDKPLTPSGSSGGAVYKTPDWTSYLPDPTKTLGIAKKPNYTNLIVVGSVIAVGAYAFWPKRGK
jgi:hypothetical protein